MGGPRTLLVTGAAGQIGSELTTALRERHGTDAVVTSDIGPAADGLDEPCEVVDVTDRAALDAVIEDYDVDTVYHLAAILSAAGERDPQAAYRVNVGGGVQRPGEQPRGGRRDGHCPEFYRGLRADDAELPRGVDGARTDAVDDGPVVEFVGDVDVPSSSNWGRRPALTAKPVW